MINSNAIDFKTCLDQSMTAYMIADKDGLICYANDAYIQQTQLSLPVIGRHMNDFVASGEARVAVAQEAIETRKRIVRSSVFVNSNIPYVATCEPIWNEDGTFEGVFTRLDIADQLPILTEQIQTLKKQVTHLQKEIDENSHLLVSDSLIFVSNAMQRVCQFTEQVKDFEAIILLKGESGVGKDVIAHTIHENSMRKNKPFISINCGAVSDSLLEAELFGYESGSFTGANKGGKRGFLEASNGGTLFLDEIGDATPSFQIHLLRAIETRTFVRVGGTREIPFDTKIICATNQNLEELVEKGLFRKDLYYRINVIPIDIPPLRERREDILPLCKYFLNVFNRKYGFAKYLDDSLLEEISTMDFPGNVRELRNLIERMVVFSRDDCVDLSCLEMFDRQSVATTPAEDIQISKIMPLKDALNQTEYQLLKNAQKEFHSCRKIADALGIDYSTVSRKLKQYNLQ